MYVCMCVCTYGGDPYGESMSLSLYVCVCTYGGDLYGKIVQTCAYKHTYSYVHIYIYIYIYTQQEDVRKARKDNMKLLERLEKAEDNVHKEAEKAKIAEAESYKCSVSRDR